MKKTLLFICCLLSFTVFSQIITGTVYDENKEPIPGASVYLDGTSIGTITNDHGRYELHSAQKINTTLVVSYIGYQPKFINNPFENNNQEIYLIPKETTLKEVTVQADGFKRADKLKIFRQEFLGKTKAGKSCKILNEDDIVFGYKNKQLSASSQIPIRIYNPYLGYEMEFSLSDFHVLFHQKSISPADIYTSFFAGTIFYKDLTTPKKNYSKKRQKTYSGSQMQFFRNLSQKKWNRKNFMLFDGSYPCNPNDYFIVQPQSENYTVLLKNQVQKSQQLSMDKGFSQTLNLLYDGKEQSSVVFKTDTFTIDAFGNNSNIDQILFGGDMGTKRVADMLPLDFQE